MVTYGKYADLIAAIRQVNTTDSFRIRRMNATVDNQIGTRYTFPIQIILMRAFFGCSRRLICCSN